MNHAYRVLMFSPAFAPFANAEAIVNSKLVLAMLGAGWAVDVISRNLVGMSTYDYGTSWSEPWLSLKTFTHEISYEVGGRLGRVVKTAKGGLKMGHFIAGCRWADHAYNLAMVLHNKKPYDVILSRAFPDAAHLPAMKMAQQTGLPWTANWNDPWEFLRERKIAGHLKDNIGYINYRFILDVSRKASWHTFPGEKLRNTMCTYFGHNVNAKSSTIPHIALPLSHNRKYKRMDKFNICYSGRLRKQQNPAIFLAAFKEFIKKQNLEGKVLFTFIGMDDIGIVEMIKQLKMGVDVNYLGKCSYLDSLSYTGECDILLVIDPPDSNGIIMTSKFVDYAQTGRPILAITNKDSTLTSILSRHGGGIAADCDSEMDICKSITELYLCWENRTLDTAYGSGRLYDFFSPRSVIAKYEDIFSRIGVMR